MQGVLAAIRTWFEQRNLVWLQGDTEPLHTKLGVQPAVDEMLRRRQMHAQRGTIDRKAISDVQILSLAEDPPKSGRYVAEVVENIRFVYEMGTVLEHEQRQMNHTLIWDTDQTNPQLILHTHAGELDGVLDEAHLAAYDQEESSFSLASIQFSPFDLRSGYDRTLAVRYAQRWWNDHNPAYVNMGVDCTNYVSQVLHAGLFPMIGTGNKGSGWWYQAGTHASWSYSWAVANALARFAASPQNHFRAKLVERPQDLVAGDTIAYDWKGTGSFGHNTVVVGHDADGYPLVNAHTVNSQNRFYSYQDSYAWTPNTRYLFIHFLD